MEKLQVFVQSVPHRPVWNQMRDKLEASDIGKSYTRIVQKPHEDWKTNFLNVLTAMSFSPCEYVVRFEDDCVDVNKHIRHNLLTWPAIEHPEFGAGWGYHPGNIPGSDDRWHFGGLPGSLCTLFKTEDMPYILDYCKRANVPQDIAMSEAIGSMKKQICIHGPSLVQHAIGTVSAFGHVGGADATSRCFDPDWKR